MGRAHIGLDTHTQQKPRPLRRGNRVHWRCPQSAHQCQRGAWRAGHARVKTAPPLPSLVWASKSPPTLRLNQMEVPASTKWVISTTRLSFALGIGGHGGGVFEVKLDLLTRLLAFQGFGLTTMILRNAAEQTQDLPDGGLRAWQAHTCLPQLGVAMHRGQDGLWSANPLQVLWRALTNLQNALH